MKRKTMLTSLVTFSVVLCTCLIVMDIFQKNKIDFQSKTNKQINKKYDPQNHVYSSNEIKILNSGTSEVLFLNFSQPIKLEMSENPSLKTVSFRLGFEIDTKDNSKTKVNQQMDIVKDAIADVVDRNFLRLYENGENARIELKYQLWTSLSRVLKMDIGKIIITDLRVVI